MKNAAIKRGTRSRTGSVPRGKSSDGHSRKENRFFYQWSVGDWRRNMGCLVCENLKQVLDSKRSKYINAVCAPYYLVSMDVAAWRNVDIELAKSNLEDHRLLCAAAPTDLQATLRTIRGTL